mmetsp:Transcript_35853/g.39927  ORF Transcript_35853/g.39927 Transcript_35853/m.39927 type:complete len:217 (+) Transcript_35853:686-1336(+)
MYIPPTPKAAPAKAPNKAPFFPDDFVPLISFMAASMSACLMVSTKSKVSPLAAHSALIELSNCARYASAFGSSPIWTNVTVNGIVSHVSAKRVTVFTSTVLSSSVSHGRPAVKTIMAQGHLVKSLSKASSMASFIAAPMAQAPLGRLSLTIASKFFVFLTFRYQSASSSPPKHTISTPSGSTFTTWVVTELKAITAFSQRVGGGPDARREALPLFF